MCVCKQKPLIFFLATYRLDSQSKVSRFDYALLASICPTFMSRCHLNKQCLTSKWNHISSCLKLQMVNTALNSVFPPLISNICFFTLYLSGPHVKVPVFYSCQHILGYFSFVAEAISKNIPHKSLFPLNVYLCVVRKAPSLPLSFVLALSQCAACRVLYTGLMCARFLSQKAVIASVSPDVLYLFRVQAVCQHDLRSDFSQTLLFRGTRSKPCSSFVFWMLCLNSAFWTRALIFSANTTRIFEGSRIVKTGMVSGSSEFYHFFVAWLSGNDLFLFVFFSAYDFSGVLSRHGSHQLWFLYLDVLWHPFLHCLHGNRDGPLLQCQPGDNGVSGDEHLARRLGHQRRCYLFFAQFCGSHTDASEHPQPHLFLCPREDQPRADSPDSRLQNKQRGETVNTGGRGGRERERGRWRPRWGTGSEEEKEQDGTREWGKASEQHSRQSAGNLHVCIHPRGRRQKAYNGGTYSICGFWRAARQSREEPHRCGCSIHSGAA